MSFFIEFHLIQNFAPSNLNRDDTGAPKDAVFGGYRRARVSSQCLKRSVREWFKTSDLLSKEVIGIRTRHLDYILAEELQGIGLEKISIFNEIVKLSLKKKNGKGEKDEKSSDGDTEHLLSYLLFISAPEIETLKTVVNEHREEILSLSTKKKIKQTDISGALKKGIMDCLKRSRAVDIALFGRMLADMPEVNQDAACQVAHAISTHRVEREFDYFTAVDDKGGPDETGAGMIGQVEFNSATFYRYAVVDTRKLLDNLQGDGELTLSALEAFTQAMVRAIPTGKQNTFAAHNPPSFVGVCLRHGSPLNLANAFEKPVSARADQSLISQSVEALAAHEEKLAAVYGDTRDQWAYLDLSDAWPTDKGNRAARLDDLTAWVRMQVADQVEA